MHICARPLNITRRACCQLVAMLNDTGVSPCTPTMMAHDDLNSTISFKYSKPSYLPEPEEIREDHVTFLLGILILMIIALTCTFALSKISRPKIALGYGSLSNYGMFMWLPSSASRASISGSRASGHLRRSSFMVLLREIACRRDDTHRNTSSLSILSQMDMSLLPSYQTATATPTSTVSSSAPPPPPYFAYAGRRPRGADAEDVGIPLTAVTSPVNSFHSYAYQEPPPEMTRSV
ncbi:hypothetical protein PFISCL1PPCAC_16848 [Pristionchus fissidentatus]|uniref:Uncharacterized protein n=1 Tax=Pristionchus fissidentatus TaxID=1538716 RepID=A0AAV5W455_9BILA|nr:hypothetical protein PFISCL1PPCAC_16848 [Pristionchus fissidentatus]